MSSTAKKSRKTTGKSKPQISIVETHVTPATNAELIARRENAVPRGVASAAPIYAKYAENAELWDVEGNRYIDFVGGIGVLNTGHRHPKVIAAAKAQEDHYTHTSFQVVPYAPYIELAEKLNELAPGDAPKKTLLVTTGAEAVENAVKIAPTRRTSDPSLRMSSVRLSHRSGMGSLSMTQSQASKTCS